MLGTGIVRTLKVLRGAFVACFAFGIVAQTGSAEGKWKAIDVPGAFGTYPTAISDTGAVTGWYWPTENSSEFYGFLRTPDGTFTTFEVGDEHHTIPTAINAGNAVTGWYDYPGPLGFVRAADGTITTFDAGASGTMARGINKKGVIVGDAGAGFLRKLSGKIKTFRVPDSTVTDAYAINDYGVATGDYRDRSGDYHGFLRGSDGTFTTFDIPGVDNPTLLQPQAINSAGQIAGSYATADNIANEFLRDASGNITILDIGSFTEATGINSGGSIVGGFDSHGFLRTPDGQVTVLDFPGAYTTFAVGINKKGEVVGNYTLDIDGTPHAFLWKP